MTSYLLLRDNKERGPYSFDQIVQIGFKPYDLVWVQGKSAAWRYPGEVEELKTFAPVVEEQPFDRFFKKNSIEKKNEIINEEPVIRKEKEEVKKSIYVTMPFQKREMATDENSEQPVKTIKVIENPVAAQVKYPEPVEEMKEVYAKNFQQRKQKIARKSLLLQRIKKASVFLYMIALGILIGFTLKSYSGKRSTAAEKVSTKEPTLNEPQQSIASTIENEKKPEVTKPEIKDNLNLSTETTIQSNEKKITLEESKPVVQKKETLSSNKKIDTTQIPPGVDINPVTGERIKKNRTDNAEETTVSKNDISKQVTVKGSDYKRGVFGGIRDLQLTVINDSKYILDNVIVELEYIKANELPLKTDNIQFHSVSPNGSMTIAIPPTTRGVKVTYKIIKIESKEFNNDTAGL